MVAKPGQLAIYHPFPRCFPAHFRSADEARHRSEPHIRASSQSAFGLFYAGFSRPYLRHHCCFLFLRVIRCFNSPRSLSRRDLRPISNYWDVPFGYARVNDCMRLAVPFPSLPGPSSPPKPSHPPDSMGASYLYLRHYDRFMSRRPKMKSSVDP